MIRIQQQNRSIDNVKTLSLNNMLKSFAVPEYNHNDTFNISGSKNINTGIGAGFMKSSHGVSFGSGYYEKEFPSDNEYRAKLAEAIGLSNEELYRLDPIVGPNEFIELINKFDEKDYSIGDVKSEDFNKRFEKAISGDFIVNLHNHTNLSDGSMEVEHFLEQSVRYADKVAEMRKQKPNDGRKKEHIEANLPCFTVAITDHDTLETAQKVVEKIVEEPGKYKNLKVILGIEQTANIQTDFSKDPVNFELLGYCLNPYDDDIKKFLDKLKDDRVTVAGNLIQKVNEELKSNKFDLKKIQDTVAEDPGEFKAVETVRGFGFLYYLKAYLEDNTSEEFWSKLDEVMPNNIVYFAPKIEDVMKEFNKNQKGIFALAHPARVKLGEDNKPEKMFKLLSSLKEQGVTAVEANYQYTKNFYKDNKYSYIFDNMDKWCEEIGLLKAGGQDSHDNIFTHHNDVRYTLDGRKYRGLSRDTVKHLFGIPADDQPAQDTQK